MYYRRKSGEDISYETIIIKRTILCPLLLIVLIVLIPTSIFVIYAYFGHQDTISLLILILGSLMFLVIFMLPIRAIVHCVQNRKKQHIKYPINALIINVAILVGLWVLMIMGNII